MDTEEVANAHHAMCELQDAMAHLAAACVSLQDAGLDISAEIIDRMRVDIDRMVSRTYVHLQSV